jgi:acyl-CoA reductase-like NAD-dependent aldehyde dehydrogenase
MNIQGSLAAKIDTRAERELRDVINPATGDTVGSMPVETAADLDCKVALARTAFAAWRNTGDEVRKTALLGFADAIASHLEELAQLLTREQGKPLSGPNARFEVQLAVDWLRYYAGLDLPVEVIHEDEKGRVELHRKPIGVIGCITPWNWPLLIAIWQIAPAIRAGNTMVLKPSPYTPLTSMKLGEMAADHLPVGVFNVITGNDDLGALMSAHAGIDKISFTGSTATGKKVMASASGNLKRLTLELGGNDAAILLPDVDPTAIVERLFWGAFINNGQTCTAIKRLYVHDSIYYQVCETLAAYMATIPVGDGLDETSLLGPIQNQMQFDKVVSLVEDAKARGARILIGGQKPNGKGYFFPLTLVADIPDDARLVREEQFGPVLPVLRYTDIEDAIARANDDPAGLGGSVWSGDPAKARELVKRLECGSAWVNQHTTVAPHAPFGGVKQSGFGTEHGIEGLKEFTTIQTVHC